MKNSMKPELAKVRGLGSSKSGTHHFIAQRFTALSLVPLFLFLIYFFLQVTMASSYDNVLELVGDPLHAVILSLTLILTLYHAQLGLQIVIEDYIHHKLIKILLIWGMKVLAIILAIVGIYALLQIAL